MPVPFVQSNQVVQANGQDFVYPSNPNGIAKAIPCNNAQPINAYWRIPKYAGNQLQSFNYIGAPNSTTPPTADSIKVLEIQTGGDQAPQNYKIAIANTDYYAGTTPFSQFQYLCGETGSSGGTLPVMPTVTIPIPIQQNAPAQTSQSGGVTTNLFYFQLPYNPLGLGYNFGSANTGMWLNGVNPTPVYAGSATTAATFVTYANANWSAYGTWARVGTTDTITLTSLSTSGTFVQYAGWIAYLTPAAFCLNAELAVTGAVTGTTLGAGGATTYLLNGIVTITGGGGTGATVKITGVSAGAVTSFVVVNPGSGYSVTSGAATTGGGGTGFTVNITSVGANTNVNGIAIGGGAIMPIQPFILTGANTQTLQNAIQYFYQDALQNLNGASFSIGVTGGNKLTVTTTSPLCVIYNGTTPVLTATAGACS